MERGKSLHIDEKLSLERMRIEQHVNARMKSHVSK